MNGDNILKTIHENFELKILLYVSIFCLIFSSVGLIVDERILNYSPLWLKPLKFAISSLLYGISLIYFASFIPKQRFLRTANAITCYGLIVELIIIYLQAYRGRMSHFNFMTLEDMILFQIMGVAIILVWISLSVYLFGFFKLESKNDPMIPAIRVGLIIGFLSMIMAFFMTSPSQADMEKAIANKGPIGTTMGSHSVKETDESKRLPITGWSRTGGDLRIAHFIGLHAMQILPLIGFFFRRIKLKYASGLWIINVIGFCYLGLVLFTLWKALSGIPLL